MSAHGQRLKAGVPRVADWNSSSLGAGLEDSKLVRALPQVVAELLRQVRDLSFGVSAPAAG